ncbi:elongation factor P [Buchnera aphidicola]|uniref:Elongation factor P n=1 Tax=Buchnera aphidicola (Sarucallis kahawaluokalani) TaxID=1241878 RepID=A0A4D6YJ03_9GAMM|nr:elongation factor P [Buchnera aphidicola]QCI25830.1 elongation factor P [Buchnera aphidicola (Sarucallis kahawaluokalani)]
MILYFINNFKSGLKVLFENQPYIIENVTFVKPGKGQVFSRVKLRNLLTNQLLDKTFRSTDSIPSADVLDIQYLYIYYDRENWYFMHPVSFEQLSLNKSIIRDKNNWLIEQKKYLITFWNSRPISIEIGKFVNLRVIAHIIDKRSNFVMNSTKFQLFKLQSGLILKLPSFIHVGDIVKIDTKTGEYHSRINM